MEDQVLISRDKLEELEKKAKEPRDTIMVWQRMSLYGESDSRTWFVGKDEAINIIQSKASDSNKEVERLKMLIENIKASSLSKRIKFLFTGEIT